MRSVKWAGKPVFPQEWRAGHKLNKYCFPWLCLDDKAGELVVVVADADCVDGDWSEVQVGVRLSDLVDGFIAAFVDYRSTEDLTAMELEVAAAILSLESAATRLRAASEKEKRLHAA